MVLGIVDAARGIRLPVYFWVGGAIVGAGLLVGLALRRTPWSRSRCSIPAFAGMIAFGNTQVSLHDGVGQPDWTPTAATELKADYRLAFGQGVLDLRNLPPVDDAAHGRRHDGRGAGEDPAAEDAQRGGARQRAHRA